MLQQRSLQWEVDLWSTGDRIAEQNGEENCYLNFALLHSEYRCRLVVMIRFDDAY
jgi:hypothetical protein